MLSCLVSYNLRLRLPFDVTSTDTFLWVNPGKNTDSYIIKTPSLLSRTGCDDEPEGIIFS